VGLGIQIGFDSLALVGAVGAKTVAWLVPAAAGTATAFGALALPAAALGFGFSALGSQLQQNADKVHALRQYFIKAKQAYQNGGFTKSGEMLIPNPHAIITKLDFINGELTFGNQRVRTSYYNDWYKPLLR